MAPNLHFGVQKDAVVAFRLLENRANRGWFFLIYTLLPKNLHSTKDKAVIIYQVREVVLKHENMRW